MMEGRDSDHDGWWHESRVLTLMAETLCMMAGGMGAGLWGTETLTVLAGTGGRRFIVQ